MNLKSGMLLGVMGVIFAYPIIDPGTGLVQGSGYPSWGADTLLTCVAGSTRTAQLSKGLYAVHCGTTAWGDQGGSTVTTAIDTDRRIPAGFVYPLKITGVSDDYIALSCTAATTCTISRDTYE